MKQEFSQHVLPFVFWFVWPLLGPGMGPKCAPGGQLSNPEVSSESGHWRPDWWQKYVFKTSQEPTIVGANYSNRRVPGTPRGREWAQNVPPGASFRTPKYRPNPASGGPIGGKNSF